MVIKKSAWEPEEHRPYDRPSLESILRRVDTEDKIPLDMSERIFREKTSEDIAVHIRSIPRIVWDTIRYISMTHPSKIIQMKSATEGCLVHCGLNVVEGIFAGIPNSKETWLKAYLNDNTNTLLDFVKQGYTTEYLGHGIGQTRKIYFLNMSDKARAMEISTNYGFHLSNVVTISMVAGIAQSESLLPRRTVEAAKKEIDRFERWLKGIKYQ